MIVFSDALRSWIGTAIKQHQAWSYNHVMVACRAGRTGFPGCNVQAGSHQRIPSRGTPPEVLDLPGMERRGPPETAPSDRSGSPTPLVPTPL
jgi:hypothetical protein